MQEPKDYKMKWMKWFAPVLIVLGSAGCLGGGDGWVMGTLWVDNCKNGDPLGESFDRPTTFDLHVDFFTGESMEDSDKSVTQRRSTLVLRIQNTSNNVEVSDGLLLQIIELDVAARSFAAGQPIPISSSNLCPGGNCTLVEDTLRASLYLYSTCPDGRQALNGSSYSLAPSPKDTTCLQSGALAPPCPVLADAARQSLDTMCKGDFNDRTQAPAISQLLGHGACMYLCALGDARRGQPSDELGGFRISYGDRVAGIFSTGIVDGRAVNLQGCAGGAGEIQGMFDFELARGRSAQSFP